MNIFKLPHRQIFLLLRLFFGSNYSSLAILTEIILGGYPCLLRLKPSGSDILLDMGSLIVYVLRSSVVMVLGALVQYPLLGAINVFLGLELGNLFGTWEGYLVGVSLGSLSDLMIGTW